MLKEFIPEERSPCETATTPTSEGTGRRSYGRGEGSLKMLVEGKDRTDSRIRFLSLSSLSFCKDPAVATRQIWQ